MTEDIERSTSEGLHEIADLPGEDSYFADICSQVVENFVR
jgi:hypothetical protein